MSVNAQAPLESIAVFGGGLVALSAAIGFARALPAATVTLVLTPLDPAALADRLPALPPAARGTLARLGIDFDALIPSAGAMPRIAECFEDWDAGATCWIHAQGEGPPSVGVGSFHQIWLEAQRRGETAAFEDHVPGVAMARGHRFPVGQDAVLRLDPGLAGPIWLDRLQSSGVRLIRDGIRGHAAGSDRVTLASGATIAADLLVDATGPSGAIAGDGERIDWSATLPVDRMLLLAEAATPGPTDTYRAVASGWRAQWPLGRMKLGGLGFASALTTEARARRVFGTGGDTAQLLAIRPGRRRASWHGNVLALGDAGVETGPLGWAAFGLALAQLDLALDLLPARGFDPLVLTEYNRRAGQRADRLHDYLAAHYRPAHPRKGAFWQDLRDRPCPSTLAETLRQFARRGTIPPHEEESITRADWIAVLLGLGYRPTERDPIAMGADPAAMDEALARLRGAVTERAAALPDYGERSMGMPA